MDIKMPDYLKNLPDTANVDIVEMSKIYGISKQAIHMRLKQDPSFIKPKFKANRGIHDSKVGKNQWNLGEIRADIAKKLIAQDKDK